MITTAQLIKFLSHYNPDAEVVWCDGEEIKHVGMTTPVSGDYKIVLAPETPRRACNQCGGNVFAETHQGLEDYPFYCPTCDENKYYIETSKLNNHII